jgi:hypothetical protein
MPTTWHEEAISASTRGALDALRDALLLEGFYLAGGTGLALHLGHRLSEDLDFFHQELFDENLLLQRLQTLPAVSVLSTAAHTLHINAASVKVSFLGYSYPLLFPLSDFRGVRVAAPLEIACMKVGAIASRGAKRDFVDLHAAAQRSGLAEILRLFDGKYAEANYSKLHVLKSLTFFDDAERDPLPQMLVPLEWDEVKRFFRAEVPRLL